MAIQLGEHQLKAIERMKNGCILNGGTGSGKSRTALAYYFRQCGGDWGHQEYFPMTNPKDLYIITTARKRDTLEWEEEFAPFLLTTDPEIAYYKDIKIVVDSWNNIAKYVDARDGFFIFDEQRLVGNGAWVKAFYKIAKRNQWIMLSATPGDKWEDYIPVFVANGFYKNKSQFYDEHCVLNPHTPYRSISRYLDTGRLMRYRNSILVDMDFERLTEQHHEDIYVQYDVREYKSVMRDRWDPFKNEPIQQAAGLCYVLRKVVNTDVSRQIALLEIFEDHPKLIVFYNYNYELDILKSIYYGDGVEVAEWNGHRHDPIPTSDSWIYLVQYTAGAEGWNCITTDTMVFYSQSYSYKIMRQSAGRIDRLNTPYKHLYYYHLKSRSSIDVAISKALSTKKKFNEAKFAKW